MKRNLPDDDGINNKDDDLLPSAKKAKFGAWQSLFRTVLVDTKLGASSSSFSVEGLELLEYFKNQLSGRWKNDETITITNKELHFGVDEIDALVHYKRYGTIRPMFSYRRLLYFCHASDFFTESIRADAFVDFFGTSRPRITPSQLEELRLQLDDTVDIQTVNLLTHAIKKRQESDEMFAMQYNKQIIARWRKIKVEFLICNEFVAANIFAENFRLKEISTRHFIVLLEEIRYVHNVRTLWKFLCEKELWNKYPCIKQSIVTCINEMKHMLLNGKLRMDGDRMDLLMNILLHICYWEFNQKIELYSPTFFVNVCTVLESKWVVRFIQGIKSKLGEWESEQNSGLILSSINKSFLLNDLCSSLSAWFDDCFTSELRWILGEFADNLSENNLQSLLQLVGDRIINDCDDPWACAKSDEHKTQMSMCVAFLNKHTTLNWMLNKSEKQKQQG